MSRITEFARDRECTIRIPGVCNHRPETSVWAHANGSAAGKGIGQKSLDILGAIACFSCHDVVDGRRKAPPGWTRNDVRLAFWEGHARSVRALFDEGILK